MIQKYFGFQGQPFSEPPDPSPVFVPPSDRGGSRLTETFVSERPRTKGRLKSWAMASLLIVVIGLDLFFLFYPRDERPFPFSDPYRQKILLLPGEGDEERTPGGKGSGGWSSPESSKSLAYQTPSSEDPGR
jgi:hypothetical protein